MNLCCYFWNEKKLVFIVFCFRFVSEKKKYLKTTKQKNIVKYQHLGRKKHDLLDVKILLGHLMLLTTNQSWDAIGIVSGTDCLESSACSRSHIDIFLCNVLHHVPSLLSSREITLTRIWCTILNNSTDKQQPNTSDRLHIHHVHCKMNYT